MNDLKLIELILPEGILEYFDVIRVEKEKDSYIIHLEEKNIPPSQNKEGKLFSKGFYEPITIQDFPLRGKACFLKVKRRRWERENGETVSRDWDLVALGTRMTKEFASFLKAIHRFHTR
jgi:Mg2+ and Co2+ transporter CorA